MCQDDTFGPSCSKPTWTPWSKWSACSVPCGDGIAKRERQCDAPGGVGCTKEPSVEQRPCNLAACVSEWSDWSPCDASCYAAAPGSVASGSQTRVRSCAHPGHESCTSMDTKLPRDCRKTCPIDCPTTNVFQECSGHGNCVLTPAFGCTQEATCRSLLIFG